MARRDAAKAKREAALAAKREQRKLRLNKEADIEERKARFAELKARLQEKHAQKAQAELTEEKVDEQVIVPAEAIATLKENNDKIAVSADLGDNAVENIRVISSSIVQDVQSQEPVILQKQDSLAADDDTSMQPTDRMNSVVDMPEDTTGVECFSF